MKKLIFVVALIAAFLSAKSQILNPEKDLLKIFPEKEFKGTKTTLPIAVDHSSEMPITPLDQGNTGACLSFAISYLLTWQEGQEMNWNINLPEHQFSPSFIYNTRKEPGVAGLGVEALSFVCQQGCVMLNQFPFSPSDDTTQPSPQLRVEALTYRANDWGIIPSTNLDAVKEKLLERPLALGIWYSTYVHAVCVVGYNDTIQIGPYVGGFKYINSYGPNWEGDSVTTWGKDGYGWAPYQDHLWFFMFLENRINKNPKMVLELKKSTPYNSNPYISRLENFYLCSQTDTLQTLSYQNPEVDYRNRKFYVPFDTCDSFSNRMIMKIMYPLLDSVSYIRQFDSNVNDFILLNPVTNYFYNDTFLASDSTDSTALRRNYECNLFLSTLIVTSVESEFSSEVNFSDFDVKVFPNPFVYQTTFQISLEKKTKVSLSLYEITGRLVSEILPQQELEIGKHDFQFSENLSPGVYLLEFVVASQRKVIKIFAN